MATRETSSIGRRAFLGAVGAGVASAAVTVRAEVAGPDSAAPLEGHRLPQPLCRSRVCLDHDGPHAAGAARQPGADRWPPCRSRRALGSLETTGVAARVINTPTAFLEDADGEVAKGTIPRINDAVADLVARNPGKLYGLATVDVFSGDEGARELERAVRQLGLRGVFIESGKKGLLPDAPQARPTLAAAAALGVPVFAHPVTDPELHKRFARTGRQGVRLARGTINAAALVAMLEGGVFDELPKLRLVVTTLAIGGVLTVGGFGDGMNIRRDAPSSSAGMSTSTPWGFILHWSGAWSALLGADHVIAGTDWPIAVEKDSHNIARIMKRSWQSLLAARFAMPHLRRQCATFSVTLSPRTSVIARFRKPRRNGRAANHSILSHRWSACGNER